MTNAIYAFKLCGNGHSRKLKYKFMFLAMVISPEYWTHKDIGQLVDILPLMFRGVLSFRKKWLCPEKQGTFMPLQFFFSRGLRLCSEHTQFIVCITSPRHTWPVVYIIYSSHAQVLPLFTCFVCLLIFMSELYRICTPRILGTCNLRIHQRSLSDTCRRLLR